MINVIEAIICEIEQTPPRRKLTAQRANHMIEMLGGDRVVDTDDDVSTTLLYINLLIARGLAK